MFSRCGLSVAAVAGLGLMAATSFASVRETVVGDAYDMDSGEYLYSEHHQCMPDNSFCDVLYRDEQGELIARKQVDYSQNMQSPSLQMEDFRHTRQFQLQPRPDPELVVDAGFDNYVRLRWDDLQDGGTVAFPFLVMGRDKPIDMRAKRVEGEQCNPGEMCLEVGLDSWLLGMLVDPIALTYEKESRRLLRFRGISNLPGEGGEKQFVDIRYRYSDQ